MDEWTPSKVYLQAPVMAVWAAEGQIPEVLLNPRKAAACFHGTCDLGTGQETVTRSTVMNAEATIAHLEDILAAYPDRLFLLFWDRAPGIGRTSCSSSSSGHHGGKWSCSAWDHLTAIRRNTSGNGSSPVRSWTRTAVRSFVHAENDFSISHPLLTTS